MQPTLERRTLLKSLLATAGGLALAPALFSRAQTEPAPTSAPATTAPAKSPFETAKIGVRSLAPDFDVLMGPGGNIGVLHSPAGQLVVDCGIPQRAKDVLTALKGVSPDTLKLLVNTHWHFDHAGGNAALAAAGATIIAHENTYKRLSEKNTIEFFKMTVEPSPESARPAVTFPETTTLHHGDETITLTHVPPAHTDTDIFLYFKNADILQTGDLFFNGLYPFIDYSTNGSITGMLAAADILLKVAGPKTKIIPGHGSIGTRDDLQAFRDMLATVQGTIQPLVKAGKSLEEVVAAKPTAQYDEKLGKGMLDPAAFTKLVYTIETRELKK